MGKITGFLEYERSDRRYEPVEQRIKHWHEFVLPLPESETRTQAARCMDYGIPYCHTGCPVNNPIPDWNDLVLSRRLGGSCAHNLTHQQFPRSDRARLPRAVRGLPHAQSRRQSGDHQDDRMRDRRPRLRRGWLRPEPPAVRTGKKVAIVGSGPAGLACAQQLARAGTRCVFEKLAKAGGLCATVFPISRWRNTTSTGAWSRCRRKVTFHCGAHARR
jgi:glutamate synthase (NADPH/NADH) small chain